MIYETNSEKETFELGKNLGEQAKAGQIFCLNGDLGVGKTVFTQGFAKGLGIEENVNSPTFTIIQVYEEGRIPYIILMYIELVILKKCMKSDTRNTFSEKAYAS